MSAMLSLLPTVLAQGIRQCVPLLLAAIGELVGERAGLVNIGLEGMMLTGALAGAAACFATGSPWIGLLAGLAAGAMLGLIFALWTVWAARDQIVTGLAINLMALGITGIGLQGLERFAAAAGREFTSERFVPLAGTPFDAIPLVCIAIVIGVSVFLYRTHPGLTLMAVGENAEAAHACGWNVMWVRTFAAACCGGLAGLGGAYLTTSLSDRFQENMTGGRGFVALALVIFGRWSVPRVALAAVVFGVLDALQVSLQPYLGRMVHVLYPLLLALPYLVTLAALAGLAGRAHAPAALGRPFVPTR